MAVKRQLLRGARKAAGGGGEAVCECVFHESVYSELAGSTPIEYSIRYTDFADGTTILSQAITITETCCVKAVGTILALSTYDVTDFELERPLGSIVVDQEDETATNELSMFHYAAWEVLTPGIYTYFLVNRAGATRSVLAAQLKIEASSCLGTGCANHAVAYNEMSGATIQSYNVNYDTVADGVTILSQAITITETCCVFAVGTILCAEANPVTDFELERPLATIVVDQEDKTASQDVALFHYAAWEVLTPGTYTYFLVNRAGHAVFPDAVQLKIIAVTCA